MSDRTFSRSLSLLRQEKGVSQRVAAKELSVSQALLSHYENGIREPGLNFVLRACDYYKVSADFLLGRALSRDGTLIVDRDYLHDIATGRKAGVDSDSMGLLVKTLFGNGLECLLELLTKTKNENLLIAVANYFSSAVYTAYRHFCQAADPENQDVFSLPSQKFAHSAATIDMLSGEMEYIEALQAHAKAKGYFPELKKVKFEEQSARYQSLLQIIAVADERANQREK